MRTDPELALYGRFVVSKRLNEAKFEFQFPNLQKALSDLLKNRKQQSVVANWRVFDHANH